MSSIFKPCPFCGSTTHIEADGEVATITHDCSYVGPIVVKGHTLQEAMANWNQRAAIAAQGEPVAWLHDVVQDDGEPDQALSFFSDSFPLENVGGFRSVGCKPLYTAPPAAQGEPSQSPRSVEEICESYLEALRQAHAPALAARTKAKP
jgi:hypothetical protein